MDERERARQLAEVLLARPDKAACAACRDALDDYVTSQIAGEDYVRRWPVVAGHLDSCVDCAEAYALLYELHRAEMRESPPEQIPAPDLSFLPRPPAGPAQDSFRSRLEGAVERAAGRLRLAFSQALLDLLPPAAPALALRGGPAPPLFTLELDAPGEEIERLQVSAYADPAAPERCDVRVQVGLRGREWPDLGHIPVALSAGGARRQALTDAWGEAVFADVARPALTDMLVEVDAVGGWQ